MRTLSAQDDGIKSDSLEVTQELLSRYGGLMPVEQHQVLQDALLPMLDEQRGALRKRAINVVGASCGFMDFDPRMQPGFAAATTAAKNCWAGLMHGQAANFSSRQMVDSGTADLISS